ncbi:hypothetical protein PILCRDRAFT_825772 [Piloderma croceum F 1598]|uniref:Uncharacterized protein n=1 Tax=Piloderma croceum (strain F 1598) TaxID=765440 RepID=A0A0C3ASU9_PILCF|nr:hypothetical protein PILCRDRAFT_825772 [Piloderma croceum F 1598]
MDNEEEEDKPEEGGDMRSSEVLDQVSAAILDGMDRKDSADSPFFSSSHCSTIQVQVQLIARVVVAL